MRHEPRDERRRSRSVADSRGPRRLSAANLRPCAGHIFYRRGSTCSSALAGSTEIVSCSWGVGLARGSAGPLASSREAASRVNAMLTDTLQLCPEAAAANDSRARGGVGRKCQAAGRELRRVVTEARLGRPLAIPDSGRARGAAPTSRGPSWHPHPARGGGPLEPLRRCRPMTRASASADVKSSRPSSLSAYV